MVCGYCASESHNIKDCPEDNHLQMLCYSTENVDFNSLNYKIIKKIASCVGYKTTLPKYKLVQLLNDKRIYNVNQKNKKIKKECPICYEELGHTNITTTSCGHSYCTSCFIKLIRNNSSGSNSCPMCRFKLFDIEPTTNRLNNVEQTFIFNNTPSNEILEAASFLSNLNNENNENNDILPQNLSILFSQIVNDDEENNENIISVIDNNNSVENLDISNVTIFDNEINEYNEINEDNEINEYNNSIRRQTRNIEEYRIREEHINEMYLAERG